MKSILKKSRNLWQPSKMSSKILTFLFKFFFSDNYNGSRVC